MPPNTITLKKSQVRVQFKWEVRNTQWRIGIAMPKKRERLHQEKIRSYQGQFFLEALEINDFLTERNVSSRKDGPIGRSC